MDKPKPNIEFKFMAFGFKMRDFFLPRMNILREVGIKPGFHVLDYGCGPGSNISALVELVGNSGRIYALDIHPLAIKMVQGIIAKKQLTNVETVCSDCKTGLPGNSVDVVLSYDTLHALSDPNGVLGELHRILKPSGILSLNDRHMGEDETVSVVTAGGLFKLLKKGKRGYNFSKEL